MATDMSRFRFRVVTEGDHSGVCLVCLDCGGIAYGDPKTDPIGQSYGGAESDDDLDTVIFQADEHQSMYCEGAR